MEAHKQSLLGAAPHRPTRLGLLSFKTMELGVSSRDISGLMDGEAHMSDARSWSSTPPCVVDSVGQHREEVFSPGRKGRLPVRGKLMSGGLISYPGNQQRVPLTAPLMRYHGRAVI